MKTYFTVKRFLKEYLSSGSSLRLKKYFFGNTLFVPKAFESCAHVWDCFVSSQPLFFSVQVFSFARTDTKRFRSSESRKIAKWLQLESNSWHLSHAASKGPFTVMSSVTSLLLRDWEKVLVFYWVSKSVIINFAFLTVLQKWCELDSKLQAISKSLMW